MGSGNARLGRWLCSWEQGEIPIQQNRGNFPCVYSVLKGGLWTVAGFIDLPKQASRSVLLGHECHGRTLPDAYLYVGVGNYRLLTY